MIVAYNHIPTASRPRAILNMGATIDLRDWFWTFLQSDLSGSFIFMRILFPCKIPLQTVRKPFHTSLPSFVRLHQFPSVTDANIIIYLFLELFTEITFWKILPFCNEKICLSSRNTFNQVNWKFLPAQFHLGTHRKWEIFTRESFPGTVQDKKKSVVPSRDMYLNPSSAEKWRYALIKRYFNHSNPILSQRMCATKQAMAPSPSPFDNIPHS